MSTLHCHMVSGESISLSPDAGLTGKVACWKSGLIERQSWLGEPEWLGAAGAECRVLSFWSYLLHFAHFADFTTQR